MAVDKYFSNFGENYGWCFPAGFNNLYILMTYLLK